jgi:hypothetical protein
MAKQIQRLTAAAVKSAKAGLHPDGGGLYLQVTPSRTAEGQLNKSRLFRFVMGGRERQMGLGSLKTYGLADAREQARKCRQMVAEGQDPIAERDARKVAKHARWIPMIRLTGSRRRCRSTRGPGSISKSVLWWTWPGS